MTDETKLKLNKGTTEAYEALVAALDTASDHIGTQFDKFREELEREQSGADEDDKRDRFLGCFGDEVDTIIYRITSKIRDFGYDVGVWKGRFNIEFTDDGETV